MVFRISVFFKFIKCVISFWIRFAFKYLQFSPFTQTAIKNKKIAIYTANFGEYDSLPITAEQTLDVDWICFTDKPMKSDRWQIEIQDTPVAGNDNRMKAKWYKINSHKVNSLMDYDYTIYIDSSAVICNSRFAETMLLVTDRLGLFLHSERSSIVEEALISQAQRKYRGLNLVSQATKYVNEIGEDSILWAGGVIVRKANLSRFNEQWWECMSESLQDQISLPIALHRSSTVASKLPGSIFRNHYVMFWICHRLFEHRTD